jgi:hypothetical protein
MQEEREGGRRGGWECRHCIDQDSDVHDLVKELQICKETNRWDVCLPRC